MDGKSLEYRWVIAQYDPRSDRGKSVLAHADIGLGYVLQNKSRSKGDNVIVAFKYPAHKTIPSHLTAANESQSYALEQRRG